jgi:hypothetical protein
MEKRKIFYQINKLFCLSFDNSFIENIRMDGVDILPIPIRMIEFLQIFGAFLFTLLD